jgi:hypothetical protein
MEDFEDGIQYQSALRVGCKSIISRNKKDFPDTPIITVLTPEEFLEREGETW